MMAMIRLRLLAYCVLWMTVPAICTADDIPSGELSFRIEVGALSVINTYAKPDFTRVNFTQVFDQPPIVFTLPTTDGSNAAAHRVRNIDKSGFDIMTLEPDGEDGPHVDMALNYLAVEEGVHDLPGGRKLVVGRIDTKRFQGYGAMAADASWSRVGFGDHFTLAPAVLGQIQTMRNEQEAAIPKAPSRPWLTTAITNVSASGMRIALERSESSSGIVTQAESIGYLAVEPVERLQFFDGDGNGVLMEAIRTGEVLQGWGTCNANPISFSSKWDQTPVVLATKNTRDGDDGVGQGDGGWLRRCSTTTTRTKISIDEVRTKIGDRDRKHEVRERAGLVMFSGNFVMQGRELDHFRILHDGLGFAGLPEEVTVVACRDADCDEYYNDSVTVTFSPVDSKTSWSGEGVLGSQITFTEGKAKVLLNRKSGGRVSFGLAATPSPKQPLRCFIGTRETCDMEFASTGFEVVLEDQVAARQSQGSVSIPDCWSDFRSQKRTLSVALRFVDPVWQGPAATVNNVMLPIDGSPTEITLAFDEDCKAPITLGYGDVGEIGIDVEFSGSDELEGLVLKGADHVIFYPAGLLIDARNSQGEQLSATSASGLPLHPASSSFVLSVQAVNARDEPVRGYRPQGSDRLLAYAQRTGPASGGVEGILTLSQTADIETGLAAPLGKADYSATGIHPDAFVDGYYAQTAAAYSEVGLVRLYLQDIDYKGYPVAAKPRAIGRFIPAAFEAVGSIANRVATPGCAAASFTYMDEPLRASVQLTALNASGGVVRNYEQAFARLSGDDILPYSGKVSSAVSVIADGSDLSGRLRLDRVTLVAPWSAGSALLDLDLVVQRDVVPDGPYDELAVGLLVFDADDVGLEGMDLDLNADGAADHVTLGVTSVRFGRLSIGNAHGSELRDLALPVVMQYYGGPAQGFVTHAGDNCTQIDRTTLTDVGAGDSLTLDDTCIIDSAGSSGPDACAAGTAGAQYRPASASGRFVINLAAPGSTNTGAIQVTPEVADWARFDWTGSGLSDPAGLATFGIYNREIGVIYQRQVR
jgi:hypothetical protein